MLPSGIYPASITPFRPDGGPDSAAFAKLIAWFESQGCKGAVIGGTNGEGPSLSAVEKRDLIRALVPLRGKMEIVAGIATPSLDEAIWSSSQAAKAGASAALVMAPGYFREASADGIVEWFLRLMDGSPLPTLVYNFPQRTGITITPEMFARLAQHERMIGAKDSSGSVENLAVFAQALPGKNLFVGNETLLLQALEQGWSGSISGAANVMPQWMAQVHAEFPRRRESAEAKFALMLPVIKAFRDTPQPATYKATLQRMGIIENPAPRLPLVAADEGQVESCYGLMRERLGG